MNAEIKAKWVAALRSGEYRQGQALLRMYVGAAAYEYCCLGVLCDVVDPSRWRRWGYYEDSRTGERNDHYPTSTVKQAAELYSDECTMLATMNDADKKTFAEIADYIEQNL